MNYEEALQMQKSYSWLKKACLLIFLFFLCIVICIFGYYKYQEYKEYQKVLESLQRYESKVLLSLRQNNKSSSFYWEYNWYSKYIQKEKNLKKRDIYLSKKRIKKQIIVFVDSFFQKSHDHYVLSNFIHHLSFYLQQNKLFLDDITTIPDKQKKVLMSYIDNYQKKLLNPNHLNIILDLHKLKEIKYCLKYPDEYNILSQEFLLTICNLFQKKYKSLDIELKVKNRETYHFLVLMTFYFIFEDLGLKYKGSGISKSKLEKCLSVIIKFDFKQAQEIGKNNKSTFIKAYRKSYIRRIDNFFRSPNKSEAILDKLKNLPQ